MMGDRTSAFEMTCILNTSEMERLSQDQPCLLFCTSRKGLCLLEICSEQPGDEYLIRDPCSAAKTRAGASMALLLTSPFWLNMKNAWMISGGPRYCDTSRAYGYHGGFGGCVWTTTRLSCPDNN